MRLVTTLLIVSTVLVSCQAALAGTWYVEPDSTGDVINIQVAIASASPGDTVLLATGRFSGPGNTNVDFMGKAVTVTSVSGPDDATIDCENTSRGFIFQNNEGPSSVLSGVTIKNGFDNFSGGAVFCRSASPTIIGNTFIGSGLLFQAPQGGAIYCDSSSAVITQNRFSGNSAIEGGGLWCSGLSDITVTSNVFEGNTAINGGGITCNDSSPLIADNTFCYNSAQFGGAIDVLVRSRPTIRLNTFTENSAQFGGGIRCLQSPKPGESAVFSENIFVQNGAGLGHAIYCEDISSPTIHNNTFDGNMEGSGAGIYCKNFSDPQILNNIIFNTTGGAIATVDNSLPMIECCDVFPFEVLPPHSGGGNFFLDPMFCNPDSGNYYLQSGSPCAAGSHPDDFDCGLIGARFVGCTVEVTGVDNTPRGRTWLDQNFPNPFNPVTTIAFELPDEAGRVTLKVFDVEGGLVRTLVDGRQPAGRNFVTWDGANDTGAQVASGVYFYKLRASGYSKTLKMVLLK